MIEWFKNFFAKFEDSGMLKRIFMGLLGIIFGVTFVVLGPVFNTLAVTIIFYCFGCILFVGFLGAAWTDYYQTEVRNRRRTY